MKCRASDPYTCKLPADCRLDLAHLGKYKLTGGFWHVDLEDRILEGIDACRKLAGEAGAVEICRDRMEAYLAAPDLTTREALRQAYEAVPSHNRRYCGDMDTKDIPIRDDSLWAGIASRNHGMELPEICVPTFEDRDE